MAIERLRKYAWWVVAYNLLVIAWGVFVRASGSGDGCGSHWPLCDGELVPMFSGNVERVIEFSHRITSGMVLPLIVVLLIQVFRNFGPGSQIRKTTMFAFVMTVVEALLGAALVKFGWVDQDDSFARAGVMSFHVISTFVLVGSLSATAMLLGGRQEFQWKGQGPLGFAVALGYLSLMFLGMSGAVSALGHTLKPVDNVLGAAMHAGTHWMVRLQPLHPLIATSIGLYLVLLGGLMVHLRPSENIKKSVKWLVGIYVVQLLIGALSIVIRAPIPMQMVHLVLADVCFIAYVAVMVDGFGKDVARTEFNEVPHEVVEPLRGLKAHLKAYLSLTKPRVISLLLFTTLAAMFIAQGGWPGWVLFLAVAVGGYMSAGAANAINMVIDRDIDATMRRTSKRPTVTQAISSRNALLFGFGMAIASFAILWSAANLLTAALSFCGLVYYIVVYTLMLKRRTWQNIVIGGAAGAFPPMVGWTAVTNELSPMAWILFTLIFVWTPVHFWALALLIKDDYAEAGVPMLPVVRGVRSTVIQIAGYTVLTALVSILPLFQSQVGPLYLSCALALNAVLVIRTMQLYRQPERPQALGLYKFSMLYLALLFLVLAIDRSVLS